MHTFTGDLCPRCGGPVGAMEDRYGKYYLCARCGSTWEPRRLLAPSSRQAPADTSTVLRTVWALPRAAPPVIREG